jgi:hypothetical protein
VFRKMNFSLKRNFQAGQWLILLDIAKLYRKYEIGDRDTFIGVIQKIEKVHEAYVDAAWKGGSKDIRHEEIIKDAKLISASDQVFCQSKASEIFKTSDAKHYLFSEFDPGKFKFDDENKIRRVRNILANKYADHLVEKYKSALQHEKQSFANRLKDYIVAGSIIYTFFALILLLPLYQEYFKYRKEIKEWRKREISNSPIVCTTRTGSRYHNCYHYKGRNYETSLFEAVIDEHKTPCGTCHPPIGHFAERPKLRYPNPFLISILLIGIGMGGNGYAQRKKEEKVKQLFTY